MPAAYAGACMPLHPRRFKPKAATPLHLLAAAVALCCQLAGPLTAVEVTIDADGFVTVDQVLLLSPDLASLQALLPPPSGQGRSRRRHVLQYDNGQLELTWPKAANSRMRPQLRMYFQAQTIANQTTANGRQLIVDGHVFDGDSRAREVRMALPAMPMTSGRLVTSASNGRIDWHFEAGRLASVTIMPATANPSFLSPPAEP